MGYKHPSWLGPNGKALHHSSASMGINFVRLKGFVPAWITPPWALHVGLTGDVVDQTRLFHDFSRQRGIKVVDFDVRPQFNPPSGWLVVNRHTRRLTLTASQSNHGTQNQQLLDLIPPTRRKQERRFLRDGGKVHLLGKQDAWDDVFRLHVTSRQRKNLDPSGHTLAQLIERVRTESWTFAVVATAADGTTLASGGFLEDGQGRVVYAMGGQKRTSESGRASVAMLLEALREAQRRGATEFDFGGSLDPGVDRFYAEFGAEPHVITRWVYVPSWWKPWLRSAWDVWTKSSPYFPRPSA